MSADVTALAARLKAHVESLARTPRTPASAEHAAAREYIRKHLEGVGFRVADGAHTVEGFPCVNLHARPGDDDCHFPLVLVAAHYDSIPESPGADDNASAVAALLELARWIGPKLRSADVRGCLELAAYDLEEYGLVGSDLHSHRVRADGRAVRGMISLEMLGYVDDRPGSQNLPPALSHMYPDVGNFIGVVGNENSRELLEGVTAALRAVPGLPVEHLITPGDGRMIPATRLSDHASFWDRGYPALMITDTSFYRNPHYHRKTDTPETLDYGFLAKVTTGVCEAVWQLLQ